MWEKKNVKPNLFDIGTMNVALLLAITITEQILVFYVITFLLQTKQTSGI